MPSALVVPDGAATASTIPSTPHAAASTPMVVAAKGSRAKDAMSAPTNCGRAVKSTTDEPNLDLLAMRDPTQLEAGEGQRGSGDPVETQGQRVGHGAQDHVYVPHGARATPERQLEPCLRSPL